MKIRAVIVAIIFGIFPLGAEAQNNAADPMVSYTAYNAAIEAGNLEEAANQAMIAWHAAETTWGASNPNTGGLAYNAAWSALLAGKPQIAVEPARRALELGATPNSAFTIDEANFLLGYAEFQIATTEQRGRLVRGFVRKIEKVATSWGDFLVINAINEASTILLSTGQPLATLELANTALAQLPRLEIDTPTSRYPILFNRGVSHLHLQHFQQANSDLIDARLAYGHAKSQEDKTWGLLAVWHEAASTIALSKNYRPSEIDESQPSGGRLGDLEFRTMTSQELALIEYSSSCGRVRFARINGVGQDIVFPGVAQNMGLLGVVIAKLKIAENGKVEHVTILGVVPHESFSRSAESAIMTWEFAITGMPSVECRENYLFRVHFMFQ